MRSRINKHWHEIIEIESLDSWLVPEHYDLLVSVLSYVVSRWKQEKCDDHPEVGVIAFGISSKYPAVGIRLEDPEDLKNRESIGRVIEAELSIILSQLSLIDFLTFHFSDDSDAPRRSWEELSSSN